MFTFQQYTIQEGDLLLNEINMARLHGHVQNRGLGIMTAHRGEPEHHKLWPKIKDFDADGSPKKKAQKKDLINRINNKANKRLERHIKKAGFAYQKVNGRYVENYGEGDKERPTDEHSFMIFGKKKGDDGGELHDFLVKHGKKNKQDSVFHKPHNQTNGNLIGTKEGAFPGEGVHHDVGEFHPNRVAEFHSILHGAHTPEHQSKKKVRGKHGAALAPSKKPFAFAPAKDTREA